MLHIIRDNQAELGLDPEIFNLVYEGFWDLYTFKPRGDQSAKKLQQWITKINLIPTRKPAGYDGEASAPDCWSADGKIPSADAHNPQSTKCEGCPKNIAGSGQNNSRACRYQQRLAVVLDNEVEKKEVYQLVLPPTSVFGDGEKGKLPLQAYARHLKNHGTPITGVVTEMRFDTASPTPKLVFKPVRPVSEEEYHIIQELKDSPEAISAVTLTVAQTDGVKPSAAPALAKPQAVEAEAVEEPKKAADDVASAFDDLFNN